MSSASPPTYGRIARLRGFLPLNAESDSVMNTRGSGTLTNLITRGRSTAPTTGVARRPSTIRDTLDDEEAVPRRSEDGEADFAKRDERRLSALLSAPQMRSMRLIGNSNPRYKWEQYWKTEEELKQMKKPMFVPAGKGVSGATADSYADENITSATMTSYNSIYISIGC